MYLKNTLKLVINEDLKNDKYLLKRLSHLDWNEVLRPATSQIQYRLWKENHS